MDANKMPPAGPEDQTMSSAEETTQEVDPQQLEVAAGTGQVAVSQAVPPNYKPILRWDNRGMNHAQGAPGTGRGL